VSQCGYHLLQLGYNILHSYGSLLTESELYKGAVKLLGFSLPVWTKELNLELLTAKSIQGCALEAPGYHCWQLIFAIG